MSLVSSLEPMNDLLLLGLHLYLTKDPVSYAAVYYTSIVSG